MKTKYLANPKKIQKKDKIRTDGTKILNLKSHNGRHTQKHIINYTKIQCKSNKRERFSD